MESPRIPFVTAHQVARPPQRVLKEWRPLSTRPWTLLLFLTATAVCFGLMVAVSLAEKQTTSNIKRDLNTRYVRRDVVHRQAEASTTLIASTMVESDILSLTTASNSTSEASSTLEVVTATTEELSLTAQIYPSDSGDTTPTPTASTDVLSLTSSSAELSLTSQCTVYITITAVTYTATVGAGTPAYPTTDMPASSYTGTCEAMTEVVTENLILSLTSQSSTASKIVTSSVSESTVELSLTSGYLSLTASGATGSPLPSQELSLTAQNGDSSTVVSDAGTTLLSLTDNSGEQTVDMINPSSSSASLDLSLTADETQPPATSLPPSTITMEYISTTDANGQLVETYSYVDNNAEVSSPESSVTPSALTTFAYLTTQTDINGQPLSTFSATITISGTGDIFGVSDPLITANPTSITSQGEANSASTTLTMLTTSNVLSLGSGKAAAATSTSKSIDPQINEHLVLMKLESFQNWYYFIIVYLPKIIAVIMACLWDIIFAGLKLMEPMYQLSAHAGALAEDTMFGNFLASGFGFMSLSATLHGQWVLILSGISLGAWSLVIALISEAMIVISTGDCVGSDGHTFRCDPAWAVSTTVLKVLLAILGLIFLLTAAVTYIIIRRSRTGCFVDPSSIAAMAELLGNPTVMHDLREIHPSATTSEVRQLLGDNRYKLGFYDIVTGKEVHPGSIDPYEQRWGLVKITGNPLPKQSGMSEKAGYGAIANPGLLTAVEASANTKRRRYQLIYDAVMLLTALTIFGLVLGYYLDAKSDPLNDFFNNMGFGPRFVLTGLALILSTGWRQTSQEVTLMAPYRVMARAFQVRCGVSARRSILATTACTPFTAFYKGIALRDFMITLVAMSAILSEILLVAVSGVPFFAGQIKPSLQASAFTSLAILFLMAVTSVAVIVHNRTSAGGTRRLPRDPDTLIGVWLYLCGSELVEHNKFGLDEPETIALDGQALVAKYGGGQYAFARTSGVDGVFRWTVDEIEELHTTRPLTSQLDPLRPAHSKPELLQSEARQRPQRPQSPFQLRWPLTQANPHVYTPSLYSVDNEAYQPSHQPSSLYSDIQEVSDGRRTRPSELPPQSQRQQRPLPQDYFTPPTPRNDRFEVPARGSTPSDNQRFESLRVRNSAAQRTTWTTRGYATPQNEPQLQPQLYPTAAQQSHRSHQAQHIYQTTQISPPMHEVSRRNGRAADPYRHTQYRRMDM